MIRGPNATVTTRPDFALRVATPEDASALLRVRTSVVENHLSLAQLADRGITQASLVNALTDAEPCAWVAESAGQVVGFSMVDSDSGSVFALFVQPSHEGRGVGGALLAHAEAALFRQHEQIWLETARDSRAERLYQARGWGDAQAVGERDVRLLKRRGAPA